MLPILYSRVNNIPSSFYGVTGKKYGEKTEDKADARKYAESATTRLWR